MMDIIVDYVMPPPTDTRGRTLVRIDRRIDISRYYYKVYFSRRSEFPPSARRRAAGRGRKIEIDFRSNRYIFGRARCCSRTVWSREKKRKGKKPEGKEAKNPSAEDFQLRRLKSSRGPLAAAAAALLSSVATIITPHRPRVNPPHPPALDTHHHHSAPATAISTHVAAHTKRGNSRV